MFPLNVTSFSELFSGNQIIVYVTLAAANGVLLFFASLKFMLVLQQGGYRYERYFKWLKNKETPYRSRLMLLCLLGFLFFCVLNMCFAPVIGNNTVTSYIGFASYILFTVLYINTESAVNAKVPLKKTKRLVRLAVTYSLVLAVLSFGLIIFLNYIAFLIGDSVVALLRFSVICFMPFLIPYILFLAYCINEPFEWAVRTHYVKKTTAKLDNADVIKIGITGSFGKTSVKEILKTILSQRYRVLATPGSYNTPLGISLTVKQLDSTHDVFIAEMGARSKGDIKELARIVKPRYGVLTGVNNQHLETFKTIENTKDTKFELFENLTENGMGFFSSDNENSVDLYNRMQKEKYLAGASGENNLVTATDIKTDRNGTKFTLNIKGEKSVNCSTVLLGKHSISNICLAAAVAYKIGMSPDEISEGINRISSIGHRLELVRNNKQIVIIDDSYNSNVTGVNAAMEVLDLFEGRKIVLTPGLVELGKIENIANLEFGKTLAKHADKVIIIGKHNAEMLINGLLDGGMERENITFAKNLKRGNEELNAIMKEGDVVLFENDLPDNYN